MKRVDYVTQPFVAEPYRDSGYSRTLAQLMLQRGNQEAAMHLERGDNAARGWQQAGNVINSAVAGWQQSVERKRQMELDAAAEADRRKITGLQIESAELGLNETKRRMKGAETARNLLPLARRESGVYGYDRDLIAREMEAAGYADQLPDLFKNLDEQEAGHFKVIEARRSAIASDAFRVLQSGAADEETFDNLLEVWTKNDLAPKGDLDMMRKIAKTQGVEAALMGAAQSSPEVAQAIQQMRNANAPDLKAFKPGDVVLDARNPQAGPVLTVPPEEKAPTNIEDAILRARQAGDQTTVNELIAMKERIARAGRPPATAPPRPSYQAKTFLNDAGESVEGFFDPSTGRYYDSAGEPVQKPRSANTKEQTSTGAQKRVFQFFQRAVQADEEIEQLEDTIANLSAAEQLRLGYSGIGSNWIQSEEGQKYRQAQRAFTEARLRKDSGAAIPENEFESDRQTFFAQPGDSPETLAQKRRARANTLSALAFESGRAVAEYYGDDAEPLVTGLRARAGGAKPKGAAPANARGPVRMRTPDGREVLIPADKVEEAQARGAQVIG